MKKITIRELQKVGVFILSIIMISSCNPKKKVNPEKASSNLYQIETKKVNGITYKEDVTFMKDYIDLIELSEDSNQSKVAISAALQGRVMTSSSFGENGRSYGWINKALFKAKDTLEHINVFGGEERFWLGPEGGQYSIFFKKGTKIYIGGLVHS